MTGFWSIPGIFTGFGFGIIDGSSHSSSSVDEQVSRTHQEIVLSVSSKDPLKVVNYWFERSLCMDSKKKS